MDDTPNTRNRQGRSLLKAALAYAAMEWSVVPNHSARNGVCTCREGDRCSSPGKHPRTPKGVKGASRELAKARRWWKDNPDSNVGIATGAASGVLVIDLDDGGRESLRELQKELGPLPVCPTVKTGGGGWHLYFQQPERTVRNRIRIAPGIDIRTDGGQVIAPPSLHVSGAVYEWQIHPEETAPPELAEAWLDFVSTGMSHRGEPPPIVSHVTQGAQGTQGAQVSQGHTGLHRGSQDIRGGRKASFRLTHDEDVQKAIENCLPSGQGQRHACLFRLARALKGLPELADKPADEVEEYVKQWHEQALVHLGTQGYEDSWWDFAESWESVKYPVGAGLMTELIDRAARSDPPAAALRYENQKVRLVVSLCRELQREAGGEPFFLATRTVADMGEITPRHASRWLKGLVRDGVLVQISKGDYASRKASEWRYVGGD